MPFVVMFEDSTYFRKVGRNTRSRVGDLQDATTWNNKGHAKLALREAFSQRENSDWPTNFQIVPVKLAKYGKRETLSVVREGSYRSINFVPRTEEPAPKVKSEPASNVALEAKACPCWNGCKSATCTNL